MRAKSLIRRRGKVILKRHSSTCGELIPDGYMNHWRSIYQAHGSFSERRDILATLKDLATINDADVESAIRAIDSSTESEMWRGVWYWCRRKKPTGVIPVAAFSLENYGATEIREIAQLAVEHFKLTTGGRPNTKKLDIEFAAFLAQEFLKQNRTRPTTITPASITEGKNTPFMKFALSHFAEIGRESRDMTKILREGIRKGLNKPKRIYRQGRARNLQSSIYQSWPYRGK